MPNKRTAGSRQAPSTNFRKEQSMSTYRVDLAAGEVEEISLEEELERIQARLRRLAMKINEAPEGEEKAELRRKYRALQKKLRELGGDADLKDSYPGDDLTAAVDRVVADFTGTEDPHDAVVDLAEQEPPSTDPSDEGGGSYFGVEEMMRLAAEDDGDLPGEVGEDAALHEALRQQAEAEHFGDINADDLSDDAMWAEFKKTLGEDA